MTLILAAGNQKQLVQISDRRLSAGGVPKSEDTNKATWLMCRNGRFAVGYTGLAYHRSFVTQDWLLDTLIRSAPPEYAIYEMVTRFASHASETFNVHPSLAGLAPCHKRLSVMFSGYLIHSSKPLLGSLIVTNFQDFITGEDHAEAKDTFWVFSELESEDAANPTFVQRIGNWPAMIRADEAELRELLQADKPAAAIVGKAVDIVRKAADRPAAGRTIGKHLMSIVIPSDLTSPCTATAKLDKGADQVILADELILLGPEVIHSVRGATLSIASAKANAPAFGPKLPRKAPCWCKSGKKYKHCHGKPRKDQRP